MSEYIPVGVRRRVRDHFANCCAYCRTAEDLSAAVFEIEHITPRTAGGPSDFENLCFACPACNRFKSDRTFAFDPETGEEVPLFHPHQDAWTDHFAWNEGNTEIVALTAIGRATIAALRMNRPQLVRVRRLWVVMGEHPPAGV